MKANKEDILKMYHINGLSTHEIAKRLSISQSTVRHHLKDTKLRTRSEAQKYYLKTHLHQRKGERHSEEAKQKISLSLKGKKRHGRQQEKENNQGIEEEVQPQRTIPEGGVVQAP